MGMSCCNGQALRSQLLFGAFCSLTTALPARVKGIQSESRREAFPGDTAAAGSQRWVGIKQPAKRFS